MSKIKIEDVISKGFTDDKLKNALAFVAHLRTLDLPLKEFDKEERTYYFDIEYKGIMLCFIHVSQKSITVYSSQVPCSWIYWSDGENDIEYTEPVVDDIIKKAAWKKVRKCGSCGCKSAPGTRKKILGKEFDNVCVSALGFRRPTADADWECIKQMVTAMKNDIDNMQPTKQA